MPSSKDPSQLVQPSDGKPPAGTSTPGGVSGGSLLYGPGPNWADGTTNPATTLGGETTKIILDLSSLTGGTAKLGGAPIVGANDTIASGTLFSQLGFLKQAAHIEYAGGGTWADGTTNPATLVSSQLTKIVSDLSGSSGTAKIGSAALVGTTDTIAAGTLFSQLGFLKQAVHIEYAGGGSWVDGDTLPAQNVGSVILAIVNQIAYTVAPDSGAEKMGSSDLVGANDTIVAGSLHGQLGFLKQASHIEYAGGGTWADGTTNPATLVSSQFGKIISDLTLTTGSGGSGRIGSSALVGANDTISAGTLRSQLLLLKQAAHIEYAGGGTWADASTNPATLVENQLDKIISDLGGSGGSAKIGAPVTGGFQAGQISVRAQLDSLDAPRADAVTHYVVGSRAESRIYAESPLFNPSVWGINIFGDGVDANSAIASTPAVAIFPLRIPHGQVLTSLTVYYEPSGGHGALPTNQPKIELFSRQPAATTGSQIGLTVQDNAPSTLSYQTLRSLTISGLSLTSNRTVDRYYARFTSEFGTNAVAGLLVIGLQYTINRTYIGEE